MKAARLGDRVAQFLLETLLDWDSCVLRVEQDYGTPMANASMALYCDTNSEYCLNTDRLYRLAGGEYLWLCNNVFDHECLDVTTRIERVDVVFEEDFSNLQTKACNLAEGHVECTQCRALARDIAQIQLPNVKNNAACRLWFLSHTARSALSNMGVATAMCPCLPADYEKFLCEEYDQYFQVLCETENHCGVKA